MRVSDLLVEFKELATLTTDVPVLTLTERNGFMRQEDRFHKRLATEDVTGYKLVHRNDIAFNPYLLWAGAVAQNQIVDTGIISPLYPTFRVRDGWDPHYVYRLLLTEQMIGAYDGIAFGSVPRRRRSSVKDFLSLPIPDQPAFEEQRRIAAILDQADATRAKRRQVLDRVDSLGVALFRNVVSSSEVADVPAGELMPHMRNGLSPSSKGTVSSKSLTLSAITRGQFDPSHFKVAKFDTDPPEDKRVSELDFLMCRGNGNASLVGVGAYSDVARGDLVFPDTMIAGRVDPQCVLLPYLASAWRQQSVRTQILARSRTTSGIFKVNQQSLAGIIVPVVPLPEQRLFANGLAIINRWRDRVTEALERDDELFASLQSRAFRGEL